MLHAMESRWRYPIAILLGLGVGTWIGAAIATLYLMARFGEDLGGFDIFELWLLNLSDPRIKANPAVEHTAWLITALPALLLAATGATSVHRGSLTDYDDAHFQSRPELRRNRMSASLSQNGFLFGKLGSPASRAPFVSATPDRFPHAMMIAPTGRGKGVGFVLPNLLHFQGSAVILDVKGENFEKTSIHRQKALNNQVWYFSPYDYVQPEGKNGPVLTRTHRFNPLQRIADLPSPEQQYTAVNTMADLFLIVESVNAQSFFQAGRSLFVASCLYAIETGKPTIGEALRIMTGGGNKKEFYKRAAMQTANPVVAEIFLSMADEVDKILDSYVSVIRGAGLELWLDPAVDRATQASDFDFGTFRRKPQSLYIVVQPEHLKTLAPLIRLLFADAIACLQRAHPGPDEAHPVMFLMDEFDQLGKQPLVLQSIKTIRSYGGRLFIISQSIPGLEGIYGETDRRALQAGAGVQIYMTPQDDRTADVLSAALGKRTIVGKTRSQATVRKLSESANISRRSEERALVSPAELLRFPLDKVLVLPEGQYPIKADHIRYYADRHFEEIDKARQGHALPYPPAAAPVSNRPKKITLEQPEPAAPAAISMGDKEFETAVQTYTGALQGYAEAARAKPKKTRSGRRQRSSGLAGTSTA